jgi:hypothetical protein
VWSPLVTRPSLMVSLLTVAALATKETAVAMGPLLLLMAVMTPAHLRRTHLVSGLSASAITAAYLLWRLVSDRFPAHPGVDISDVIAVVTGPFGALGLPLHTAVVPIAPFGLAIWTLVLSVILVAAPYYWRRDPAAAWVTLVAVAWIVLTAAPTAGLFGVGADLQGSRYLYLPTCLWAVALTSSWIVPAPRRIERYLRLSTFVIALLLAAIATERHQRPWIDAASIRDVTLGSIAVLPGDCRRVFVIAAPDNVRGAYVARNSLPEALAREHGRVVEFVHRPEDASPQCRLDLADLTR